MKDFQRKDSRCRRSSGVEEFCDFIDRNDYEKEIESPRLKSQYQCQLFLP